MDHNEIGTFHEFLQQLDLTDGEARTFMWLTINSKLTTQELSEKTGLTYWGVINALQGLAKRSLLVKTNSRPVLFDVDPVEAINKLVGEKEKIYNKLRNEKKMYLKIAVTMRNQYLEQVDLLADEEIRKSEVGNGNRRELVFA